MAHTIRVTFPTARATGRDRQPSAEIQLNGSPFRYKLWFAWVQEDGEERLVPAEAAILQHDEPHEGQMVEALTPPVVTDFHDRWEALERTARAALGVDPEHDDAAAARPPRTRREMTPEFLTEIVRRHNAHRAAGTPATEALAREERVGASTVRHWLRKAREAGVEGS